MSIVSYAHESSVRKFLNYLTELLASKRLNTRTLQFGTIHLTSPSAPRYAFCFAYKRPARPSSMSDLIILTLHQTFDFDFEEEDSIEGMKKLIVDEVNLFRQEVRAQARAASQGRRQDTLPIPSHDDIAASPIQEDVPANGATSGYYSGTNTYSYNPAGGQAGQQGAAGAGGQRPSSPVMDDPSAELERELAGTHIGRQ